MPKRSDTHPEVMKSEPKGSLQRGAHLVKRRSGDARKATIADFEESPNVLETEVLKFRLHRQQPQALAVGDGLPASLRSMFLADKSLPIRPMQLRDLPRRNESLKRPGCRRAGPGTKTRPAPPKSHLVEHLRP